MATRELTKAEIAEFDPTPTTKLMQLKQQLARLREGKQEERRAGRDQLERQLLKIRSELTRCRRDLESCKEAVVDRRREGRRMYEDCKRQLKDKDARISQLLRRGGGRTKKRRRGGRRGGSRKRRRRGGRTKRRRRGGRRR